MQTAQMNLKGNLIFNFLVLFFIFNHGKTIKKIGEKSV
ncbi:hypothetical protein SacRon12I_08310 [Sulfolobus acidocaldarius Ron12/I]|uniref:Uncharacterized protein n=1 Tax=Sulfolobus acidocaldarius Ron12/I TaxID=1028567 RepID=M1IEF3_9CREN|nr:hypothetical protein SacRon12I_08310 [Sulfolobus acidocaldarius Ron12/I]